MMYTLSAPDGGTYSYRLAEKNLGSKSDRRGTCDFAGSLGLTGFSPRYHEWSTFPAGPCMVDQGQVFEGGKGGKAMKGRQTSVSQSQLSTIACIDLHQDNHFTRLIMTTRTLPMELQSNISHTAVAPSADRASIWLCSLRANSFQRVKLLSGNYRVDFDASRPTEQISFTACDREMRDRIDVEPIRLTPDPLEPLVGTICLARLKAFSTVRERDDNGGPLESVYGIELSNRQTSTVSLSVAEDGQIETQFGPYHSCDPLNLDRQGQPTLSTQAPPSIPHRQPH
jgi:hypothetical protein